MTSSRLLITGASGYIGSHVIQQALEAGYSINATARPNKAEALKTKFSGKINVFDVEDIATGDYTEALKGVDAIVHVASPLPWAADPKGLIDGAVNGSINILRQGLATGVKKAVITGSAAALIESDDEALFADRDLNENDWNTVTREDAEREGENPGFYYSAAKTIAEQEVWRFADEHPEMDITTIIPTYVIGPTVPGTKVKKGDLAALSTLAFIFKSRILPDDPKSVTYTKSKQQDPPVTVDVRDVARAHILALSTPPTKSGKHKRLPISGPPFLWYDAVKYLQETRTELCDRLPRISEGGERLVSIRIDGSWTNEVLDMNERIDWKKSVDDSIDDLLRIEKEWEREN